MMNEEDKKIASELIKEYYDKGFKSGFEMAIASLKVIYDSLNGASNKSSDDVDNNEGESVDGSDKGHKDAE